ncbi:hypothetical protein [Sphingomonas sp.]|jgi:hypothetical protein|uniref:hypothetical protein n=1 Tax=Sphingomonas sp. TaxID=28214 RepID=UPI002D7F6517|nr:hypothetical protein [Sphingomonas sp.]HEU0042966.1 hypothetical protein [Sphingomonas sp.]
MSRAVNVNATPAEVSAMCNKHKATISAIEALPAGGTRVVLMNADDAAVITKAYAKKLLATDAARTPLSTRWR